MAPDSSHFVSRSHDNVHHTLSSLKLAIACITELLQFVQRRHRTAHRGLHSFRIATTFWNPSQLSFGQRDRMAVTRITA
jgi:hypothetical protein